MSTLPEGLRLQTNPRGDGLLVIVIVDAQDIPMVTFSWGEDDPEEWTTNIVLATCKALGVTEAFDDEVNQMTPEEFMQWYREPAGWEVFDASSIEADPMKAQ